MKILKNGKNKVFYGHCPVCETEFTFKLSDVSLEMKKNGNSSVENENTSMLLEAMKVMQMMPDTVMHKHLNCPSCEYKFEPNFIEYKKYKSEQELIKKHQEAFGTPHYVSKV